MKNTKVILYAIGGVAGLAVLALGYFLFGAFSEKSDLEMEYQSALDDVSRFARGKVLPCNDSVVAIKNNCEAISNWWSEAQRLVSAGDRVYEKLSPAQFKTYLIDSANRIANLPGAAEGKFVKAGFGFGPFKDFIADGKMPDEKDLPRLQRQWDDFEILIAALSKSGVVELTDLQIKENVSAQKSEEEEASNRNNKKKRKAANKKVKTEAFKKPTSFTYVLSLAARPAAIVKSVNAIEANERFMIIDSFTMTRATDTIAEALAANDKQDQPRSRRGRRGRGGADQEKDEKAPESVIVTDPALDAPRNIVMTVSTYDFRTLEQLDDSAAEKGDEK
jgi:hypothetical protein